MAIGSVPGVLVGTRILAHFAGAPSTIRFLIGLVLVMTPVLAILMEIARRQDARWVERPAPPQRAGDRRDRRRHRRHGRRDVGGQRKPRRHGARALSPLSGVALIGTGIAHAVLITGTGAAAHWNLGNVDPALVGQPLIGSIPGVLAVGGSLVARSPAPCAGARPRSCY